ncbi:hypothetical protein Tco_1522311 [Tanacetum coccineum]
MHGDETPDAYLNRAQEYADALAAIGEPVKDKDLVMLDVSGICKEDNGLKITITACQSPTAFSQLGSPSMPEAHQAQLSELNAQLGALGFQVSPIAPSSSQAFYGARPSHNNRSNNNNNCSNHTQANSHVTPDLETMDNSEAYYGGNALHVGNDKSTHITLLTGPSKHGLYTLTLPQLKSINKVYFLAVRASPTDEDLHIDGVRDLVTSSGRGRLKEDLESSMWRLR